MNASPETWVVLGASSPVAREFARAVARAGARVVLAGRDLEDLEASAADLRARHGGAVEVQAFDARDLASHGPLAENLSAAAPGGLNIFLAFGLMPAQDEIDANPALLGAAIEASFTGAASILHALAPHLEARERGRVVALGSVAGDRGRLKNYVYGSAKAGLHAFLQGLRNRLGRSGVTVTTVKPGFVDTSMTWGLALPPLPMATPEALARASLKAAEKGRDEIYHPALWRLVMTIIKTIPERIFKKLSF